MAAGRIIYEGPDYGPVILSVTVLLGIVGVFLLLTLADQVSKVGHRVRMRRRMEAWADRKAGARAAAVTPPKGRHSGPQPAVVPDWVPRDWEDDWLRVHGDYDEGDG